MARITYEVTLAVDGKHSVMVRSDDPQALKAAVGWAKETHAKLLRKKDAEWEEEKEGEEAPTCAVHEVPMVRQRGRYGSFWSCHERNEDGSFCSYRPNGR